MDCWKLAVCANRSILWNEVTKWLNRNTSVVTIVGVYGLMNWSLVFMRTLSQKKRWSGAENGGREDRRGSTSNWPTDEGGREVTGRLHHVRVYLFFFNSTY
jgi:hypothetical protein